MNKKKSIPDDLETVLWIIVTIGLFKIFGYIPVVIILVFLILSGVNEIFDRRKSDKDNIGGGTFRHNRQ